MEHDRDIQLSDLLESYPPNTTPEFQTMIASKKEFSELASGLSETLPSGRGKYFKHQTFTHRFMRAYDSLLVLSETGTGKSCEVLGFTEYTRKELEKSRKTPADADISSAHFKKVVIMVKGDTQRSELRSQLVCKCSDGHYESESVREASSRKVQKSNISREISKAGYEITTYTTFAHHIARKYPKTDQGTADLIKTYSDTIFVIDEAHNLLVDITRDSVAKNVREKQITYETLWRLLHTVKRSKTFLMTATPMINADSDIGSLLNLILPRNKILPEDFDYKNATEKDIQVLFPGLGNVDRETATREEMGAYFRGQIPNGYNFSEARLEDLEPYFRGRIGYVRASETGAVPVMMGEAQTDRIETKGKKKEVYVSQLVLYTSPISQHQENGVKNGGGGYRAATNDGARKDFSGALRQAANFVFPDGYWGRGTTEEETARAAARRRTKIPIGGAKKKGGKEGESSEEVLILPPEEDEESYEDVEQEDVSKFRAFRRYVEIRGDNYKARPEFKRQIKSVGAIHKFSAKYASIIKTITTEEGSAFVYGEYTRGSGSIVLALCLEGVGFERFDESSSIFESSNVNVVRPYCDPGKAGVDRKIRKGIKKSDGKKSPFRYALLTRKTTPSKFSAMMEAMNSYENRHGEYIKVLISSRVGRDALNVNNVLQIHLIGPEWNESAMYQAISRGVRAVSHVDLLEEKREEFRKEGKDPSEAKIQIKVYKHAIYIPSESKEQANDNIDFEMYRTAESKDRKIKRVMRFMKQCSVGCLVHYQRNVREGDKDNTPQCDYDVCKYLCFDPPPTYTDYSTYNVSYSSEIINSVAGLLKKIFTHNANLTLDEISRLLPGFERTHLIMGLEQLISKNIQLVDRFGYSSYLSEDMGTFYLLRSYPRDPGLLSPASYYSDKIITTEKNPLFKVSLEYEKTENEEKLQKLQSVAPDSEEFARLLSTMSIDGQIGILEDSVLKLVTEGPSDFINAVMNRYRYVLFEICEPLTKIKEVAEKTDPNVVRRGRKPKPGTKVPTKKINFENVNLRGLLCEDSEAEKVYVHTLYSQLTNRTSYASTARSNKGGDRIRMLKPSTALEKGWRDLSRDETEAYNVSIQASIMVQKEPFEEKGIYGFKLFDEKFKIRDPTTQDPGASEDPRKIKRGEACTTWPKENLIKVMWEIGVPALPSSKDDSQKTKEELVKAIKSSLKNAETKTDVGGWDIDRLRYYYGWITTKSLRYRDRETRVTRDYMCELIEKRMKETDRFMG